MRDCDGTQELILGVPRLTVVAEGARAATGFAPGMGREGGEGESVGTGPVSDWGIPVISTSTILPPPGQAGGGGGGAVREVGAYEQALKNRLRRYFDQSEELGRRRAALLGSAGLDVALPYDVFWFPWRGVYVFRTQVGVAEAPDAGWKGGTVSDRPTPDTRRGTAARRELLAALESAIDKAATADREGGGAGWSARLSGMARRLRSEVEGCERHGSRVRD